MTTPQKLLVFGFLAVFIIMIVIGILATGLFKKEKKPMISILASEKESLSFILKELKTRGLRAELGSGQENLTIEGKFNLSLQIKRGLPWVIFEKGPNSMYYSKEEKYTLIELSNPSGFQGFLGKARYKLTQNYAQYFSEEYSWTQEKNVENTDSKYDNLLVITDEKQTDTSIQKMLEKMNAVVSKCPTAHPPLIIANDAKIQIFLPFWAKNEEMLKYLEWLLRHLK